MPPPAALGRLPMHRVAAVQNGKAPSPRQAAAKPVDFLQRLEQLEAESAPSTSQPPAAAAPPMGAPWARNDPVFAPKFKTVKSRANGDDAEKILSQLNEIQVCARRQNYAQGLDSRFGLPMIPPSARRGVRTRPTLPAWPLLPTLTTLLLSPPHLSTRTRSTRFARGRGNARHLRSIRAKIFEEAVKRGEVDQQAWGRDAFASL